jgi:hypothetical protein
MIIAYVQILVCNTPVFATAASLHTTYSHISMVDRLPLINLIERVIILNENKTYHNHAILQDCSDDSITYRRQVVRHLHLRKMYDSAPDKMRISVNTF